MYSINFIFIRGNMTSSSYFNIFMMRCIFIITNGMSNMFLCTISCISLRLTMYISRLLIRMMNCLSSYNFSLYVDWCTFFIFWNWVYIMIWLRNVSSLNMRLTLTLIIRCLNIRLRLSLDMIISITFIYNFYIWICLFIFFPTIIYSCLYIIICLVMWCTLYIGLCMRWSMYISFSMFSIRCTLNVTLSVSMSCWLTMYVSSSWFVMMSDWCCINISSSWFIMMSDWCCINVSSSGIRMNNMRLIRITNRGFFLFKCLHIRIIIIMFYMLIRCAINMGIMITIKIIVILLNMYWCRINFNMCWLFLNNSWGSMNIDTITTMITMSY